MSIELASAKRKLDNVSPTSSTSSSSKRVRFNLGEKENKETKVNITTMGKGVSDMDHTKIISELLKKYPDLMKKNKNIRLKIMPKNSSSPMAEKCSKQASAASKTRVQMSPKHAVQKVVKVPPSGGVSGAKKDEGPWVCTLCSNTDESVEFVLYYLYRKHMTDVHREKFDSRMCKFCGHKSNKHNMLMYHMYTKHGVKPPPAYSFPKCNQCHYIALTEALLIKHKLNHTKFELQCSECKVAFSSQYSLDNHVHLTGHTGKFGRTNYDCQYCAKQYQSGANLFSHIKMQHREEAKRDGIVSIDEIEEGEGTEIERARNLVALDGFSLNLFDGLNTKFAGLSHSNLSENVKKKILISYTINYICMVISIRIYNCAVKNFCKPRLFSECFINEISPRYKKVEVVSQPVKAYKKR